MHTNINTFPYYTHYTENVFFLQYPMRDSFKYFILFEKLRKYND